MARWTRNSFGTWRLQLGMFEILVCYDGIHGGGYVIRGSFGPHRCEADGKEIHYENEKVAKRDAEIIAQDELWRALEPFGVVRP